jgi:ketosteroid isomerase-like protein
MDPDDDEGVLAANEAFYLAFASRNVDAMDELWARERPVTCVHPGWDMLVGRPAVMASWRAILRSENPLIEASAARVQLLGRVAYVLCFEGVRGEAPVLVATNIFIREEDRWRLVHHHAGQLASPRAPESPPPVN